MSTDRPTEIDFIKSAAAGNMGAFADLVRQHRPRVLRTATGIVGSTEEAEDVAQQVFIKVWNALPGFDSKGSFSSWVYRITVNTALDVVRRRRQHVSLDDLQRAGQGNPEDHAMQTAKQDQVRRAIAALPPASRTTLVLREYEQLSYKEIAKVLDIPIGTVMSRLNYARKALARTLAVGDV